MIRPTDVIAFASSRLLCAAAISVAAFSSENSIHASAYDNAEKTIPNSAQDGIPDLSRSYDPNSLLVMLHEGVDRDFLNGVLNAVGASIEWESRLIPRMLRLDLNQPVLDTTLFLHNYGELFQHISPDYMVSIFIDSADPLFTDQWGMKNTRQFIGNSRGFTNSDIDATDAWSITTGDDSIVVGIVDQGTYYSHPDLNANVWVNEDEVPNNSIDDDNNGYIDDIHGWDFTTGLPNTIEDQLDFPVHGTHVSGTICAPGDNGIGVAGVSWRARFAPLKFIDLTGTGPTGLAIEALEYACLNDFQMTNHSWGSDFYDPFLDAAVSGARSHGHLLVIAAGNGGTPIAAYPAALDQDNIISVASVDNRDRLAPSSQYNLIDVDLGAPGVGIVSTVPPVGNPTTYGFSSGTSFAAPHVTGAAALLWSYRPNWTYQQVRQQLLDTTRPLASLDGKVATAGTLNVGDAIATAFFPPSIMPTLPEGVFIDPAVEVTVQATIAPNDDTLLTDGSVVYRIDCGPWFSAPLGNQGQTTLPAVRCGQTISYYFQIEAAESGTVSFPDVPQGAEPLVLIPAAQQQIFADSFTSDSGWTVGWAGDTATAGIWNREAPLPTAAQPGSGSDDDFCFVTDGRDNGFVGSFDVDGGTTSLVSPVLNLAGATDITVSYDRWYSNSAGTGASEDVFIVQVSSDGGESWTIAETVGPTGEGTMGGWISASFTLDDLITPSATTRIRFVADDSNTGSLIEAAIDAFAIDAKACTHPASGPNFNQDADVNAADTTAFITALNASEPSSDFDFSSTPDFFDLSAFLNATEHACHAD
ncbi:MAG: S8 family serine peptidase [Planctomycetota bacterium]